MHERWDYFSQILLRLLSYTYVYCTFYSCVCVYIYIYIEPIFTVHTSYSLSRPLVYLCSSYRVPATTHIIREDHEVHHFILYDSSLLMHVVFLRRT